MITTTPRLSLRPPRATGRGPLGHPRDPKVAEQPDVLSFAGGLPAPELFPVEALAEATPRCSPRRAARRSSMA